MPLRRGFKSEANKIAREIRSELGLTPAAPLDPRKLSEYLSIPILTLSDMTELAPNAVNYFSSVNTSEFSAMTVFDGTKRIIVHNNAHTNGRQANDISHELSHGLLLHPPRPALNANGCRDWDSDMEDEAQWLSGALLISEEAALRIVRNKMSIEEAAEFYGVSLKMVKWRLQVTAAFTRVGRTQSFYSTKRTH
jgi:Zn-dependent peptidase ImmA (M78 family)